MQLKICCCGNVPSKRPTPKRLLGCPLNASVEMMSDRWSLLIVRNTMLRGFRTHQEWVESDEGIATNMNATRATAAQETGEKTAILGCVSRLA